MASMDSQFIANLISGISALAAIVSAICAYIAWYHSIGSKKAKAEAEERARQAEESLKQIEQIASRLWRPEFELTRNGTERNSYRLRNTTGSPIEILEIANCNEFFYCEQIQHIFRPGESLDVSIARSLDDPTNLELRIRGRDDIVTVPIPR